MSTAIGHVADRVPAPAVGGADDGEGIYDVVHDRLRRNAIA